MGHLLFLVLFVFFVLIIVGKLYFSYMAALKRAKDVSLDDISPSDLCEYDNRFYIHKAFKVLSIIFILFFIFIIFFTFDKSEENTEARDGFRLLFDIEILGFFILSAFLAECFCSYVRINKDGFEYRRILSAKSYSTDSIEGVYKSSGFIFVKLKDCKIPVILETIFEQSDLVYKLLCNLRNN